MAEAMVVACSKSIVTNLGNVGVDPVAKQCWAVASQEPSVRPPIPQLLLLGSLESYFLCRARFAPAGFWKRSRGFRALIAGGAPPAAAAAAVVGTMVGAKLPALLPNAPNRTMLVISAVAVAGSYPLIPSTG